LSRIESERYATCIAHMHSLIFYRFDPGYNGIPVTYVLYPDEGHGFARPENSISFNAITEAFLERQLGGRAEPMREAEWNGSTAQILEGAELLDLPARQQG
jgi:hypothetical protein